MIKQFTKQELKNYIQFDPQQQVASVDVKFFFDEEIIVRNIIQCVESFQNNAPQLKNPKYITNPTFPTQVLKIKLCIDKNLYIESSWLGEMIKMYMEDFEMQLAVDDILRVFVLCDRFANSKKDTDIIAFEKREKMPL